MMMTVVNVAYSAAPVLQDSVGGAEQIVARMDRALCAAGHRSIVVGTSNSQVKGILEPFEAPSGNLDDAALATAQANCRHALQRAITKHKPDVIHMHGLDFDKTLPFSRIAAPVLVTLHLPLEWYSSAALVACRPGIWFNCISYAQNNKASGLARLLPPVGNGVEVQLSPPRIRKRNFLLAMGRICPEKCLHHALDAAKAADMPLLLAGDVFQYEGHEAYFQNEIIPRLDSERRFIGPIAGDRKRRLMSAARAILIPSCAPETSSLVAMEAMAVGTPVIAYPSGALPEILDQGRTGFLVHSMGEMIEAIGRIDEISPLTCHATARERFCAERMTARYVAIYKSLIAMPKEGMRFGNMHHVQAQP